MSDTKPIICAVIGNPISHSLSPDIHQAFAHQFDLPLEYSRLLAPIGGFNDVVLPFFAAGARGMNVTAPFKLDAYALASHALSARARVAGAVNTLWQQDGIMHGCNTDGIGLVQDLQQQGAPLRDAHVLIIGAGGAARGVLQALLAADCASLRIVNRNALRAQEMIANPLVRTLPQAGRLEADGLDGASRPGGWDLVINATSSSLGDAALDLPAGLYASAAVAYDMVYSARPTPFMQQALDDGASRASDGLGMLVGQAAASFEIWHGLAPDTAPVLSALRQQLATAA
ncbi:shikimate dehydrogenase [Kerstersia gyiorum]|jgi:shikimate dehydrogenase|uniref:shikimate dehydrogenase n=1 Tax=Kerstersia gyiorum TaxID=206506 RepID=UPI00242C1401|nr:shikimate dehydrogenase [Kerstersia gyiorum]MCH4270216.1 shikimate dehydrogenase [Kerstersia gyiorum]MCI1228282.1 shikimate dehydrogenase [Kerstersia gyiorum]